MSGHLPWLYSAIKRCRKYVNFRQAKRWNPKYNHPSGKMAESKAWLSAWRNDGIQSMIIRLAKRRNPKYDYPSGETTESKV